MNNQTHVVVEDLFEAARREFFSGDNGKAPVLNSRQIFTQVKSYDGPAFDGKNVKLAAGAVALSTR